MFHRNSESLELNAGLCVASCATRLNTFMFVCMRSGRANLLGLKQYYYKKPSSLAAVT